MKGVSKTKTKERALCLQVSRLKSRRSCSCPLECVSYHAIPRCALSVDPPTRRLKHLEAEKHPEHEIP